MNMETPRLVIKDRQDDDAIMENYHLLLNPELAVLDPSLGENREPVFSSIFTKEGNIHIGICCLYNPTVDSIELGVRIFTPECWSKGYGSEVINALCEHVFDNFFYITTVYAKTPIYNTRAIACYEKNGFQQYSRVMMSGYDMLYLVKRRG